MSEERTGYELLAFFEALANRHRLRMVAMLYEDRKYVSQLARELGMSRPLVYMHLNRLEEAKIVTSEREISESGKAMNYYALEPFYEEITAAYIARATKTLSNEKKKG
ncbi:ArsR/SmtB family transcription factor [Geomicrobium sp. JSM 1781026]|uniref:ArsR/SmtB family transcription factor n=1 Tax=Geomicrobium sp. JSM 1781026 TaxID=3344580 RepID=UPI0035BEF57B